MILRQRGARDSSTACRRVRRAREVRDLGLLESALYRPQTGYYEDLSEMAAALFESLLMNRGNKRVAFFAADVFLRLNGWRLSVEPSEAHALIVGLLERQECDFEHLQPWIRRSMARIRGSARRA